MKRGEEGKGKREEGKRKKKRKDERRKMKNIALYLVCCALGILGTIIGIRPRKKNGLNFRPQYLG